MEPVVILRGSSWFCLPPGSSQKPLKSFDATRVFQLQKCPCLNLPDAFTGDIEHLADLLKGVVIVSCQAKPQTNDCGLASIQTLKVTIDPCLQLLG